LSLYSLEIEAEKKNSPVVKQLVNLNNVEKLIGVIHTAIRTKDNILLIDNFNFYLYNTTT